MTQVRNVCISRERHKLYTQDRHGRFSRIVNIPSDMFNGDVYFPSFSHAINIHSDMFDGEMNFSSFTHSRKCPENVPESF